MTNFISVKGANNVLFSFCYCNVGSRWLQAASKRSFWKTLERPVFSSGRPTADNNDYDCNHTILRIF